jgi:hypothetical protein
MRLACRLVALGVLAMLLPGCPTTNGDATPTAITTFVATPSSVTRGEEVTLRWEVSGAGSRTGVPSCSIARRVEGQEPETPFQVACSSSLTEVPPAGASATYVRYQLNVLKQPYDASDPYLTSVVTVNITPSVPPNVLSVVIDQPDFELDVGDEATLTATVSVEGGASQEVAWSTSDSTVAQIDASTGTVTAVGEGTAQVFAASVFDPAQYDVVSVSVDFGDFGGALALAGEAGPRQRYNREFVAVDGERVFFSRVRGIDNTLREGSVAVHERDSQGSWPQVATLLPPAGGAYVAFGKAIEARGSTVVVLGDRRVTVGPDTYESVLHVFEVDSGGDWSRRAVLLEGEGIGTQFGTFPSIAFALASDTLVVGLPGGDGGAPSVVRVYERNEGGTSAWGLTETIPSPASLVDPAAGYFGTDVDLSEDGELLAIATSYQGDDSCIGGESVFVFERDLTIPSAWTLIDTLVSSELIGCSTYVEIDGDTLAVTAIGATYVRLLIFERGAGGSGPDEWAQVRFHLFTVPTYSSVFVYWASSSIRLLGTTVILGMVAETCDSATLPSSPCAPGLVQVVRRDAGGVGAWGVDQSLYSDPAYDDQGFGAAIDISADGRFLVVGTSPLPTNEPNLGGEVFVFER